MSLLRSKKNRVDRMKNVNNTMNRISSEKEIESHKRISEKLSPSDDRDLEFLKGNVIVSISQMVVA